MLLLLPPGEHTLFAQKVRAEPARRTHRLTTLASAQRAGELQAMRSDLDHLPEAKRRELALILEILFAEFEDALKGRTAPHRKQGRILKIILFGSYARGDWVADQESGYRSDYDLLVVVNHDELADLVEYWGKADDHLLREYQTTHRLSAPANFIVHSLTDVNKKLRRGRPFFVDIVRDGSALYEVPDHPFEQPAPLSREEARTEARANFDEWFGSAADFYEQARFAIQNGRSKVAAFELHQATERLYHCVSLVLTLYSPKSHKLNFLRSQAERLAPSLIAAWPRETRFEQRCWELLRRAYVDARYSPHYKINDEELTWLSGRIADLQTRVRQICEAHLQSLESEARDA
jgi:predicted nucleotidyltransferase/HEPN domain-containing protein